MFGDADSLVAKTSFCTLDISATFTAPCRRREPDAVGPCIDIREFDSVEYVHLTVPVDIAGPNSGYDGNSAGSVRNDRHTIGLTLFLARTTKQALEFGIRVGDF
jgi:hypothetical protein